MVDPDEQAFAADRLTIASEHADNARLDLSGQDRHDITIENFAPSLERYL